MKKIVIFPFFNWNSSLMHREHMLARAFSELNNEVYFINNSKNVALLSQPLKVSKISGINQVDIFLVPYMKGKFWFIYKINDWLIGKQLNKLEKILSDKYIAYVTNPNWAKAVCQKGDNQKRAVYDISDDYSAFATNDKWKARISEYEKVLIDCASKIILTTESLGYKVNGEDNVIVVSNGVDYKGLTTSKRKIINNTKTIGFIGGIYDWVDLDLFEKSVRHYPQYEFALVGF
jgi:hypothetical protein